MHKKLLVVPVAAVSPPVLLRLRHLRLFDRYLPIRTLSMNMAVCEGVNHCRERDVIYETIIDQKIINKYVG